MYDFTEWFSEWLPASWPSAEWVSAGASVASTFVALVAIIIAVSSLKKQESIHRSDLSLRRSEMSHQTFLEMDRLFHELFKKDVNLQDSEQVVNFLNFTERVGYLRAKGPVG